MRFLRLTAVWLLLLALPMQGIAAYAPVTRCGDTHAATVHQAHESHAHQDHHAMTAADHGQQPTAGHAHHDDSRSGEASGHSCCHHVFTGAAPAVMPGSSRAPGTVIPRISLLTTLHIPELPQRPPRA